MFCEKYLPILIVLCLCLELHELGDIVEEGEDHNDTDVAPALAHTTLVLLVFRLFFWVGQPITDPISGSSLGLNHLIN